MPWAGNHRDHAAAAIRSALAVEDGLQQLCRTTLTRPDLTPDEIDLVLASLASAVAALPQAARQLADVLDQARQPGELETDAAPADAGRASAISIARRHLSAVRGPALHLHQLLDAAHQETATITVRGHTAADPGAGASLGRSVERRPEERQPPSMRPPGRGTGPSR